MKFVLISDTHCRLRKMEIPEGDVLLHAGDLTFKGDIQEISQELQELGRIAKNFSKTIIVPGNHDWLFERNMPLAKQMCEDVGVIVLHDSGINLDGLNIWGSAWQPAFCNWSFNLDRAGPELREKWAQIPDNTDVLVTHGPPMGILDTVQRYNGQIAEWGVEHVGCSDLYNRVLELKQLKLHVFGHIHGGYGTFKLNNTRFVNASICTEEYKPTNEPWVVEI
jgi:Icc-related predicted phosphoesterase